MTRKVCNPVLAALFLIAMISSPTARAAADSKTDVDLQAAAQQAISDFKLKDPSLEKFFDGSVGYAVFPSVGQGGLVFGGAHGAGLVYEKGALIGKATVSKATVGAQIGGESYAEVIFFQTPEALQDFKESRLELSAGIGAVAAAEGAAQSVNYQQGVAVFTLPRSGFMARAAIGGQKFKFEPLK
jgi:lipid-binding SYLF domain-containing protein